MHVDFAGLLEDFYYLIVVDSYSKWFSDAEDQLRGKLLDSYMNCLRGSV